MSVRGFVLSVLLAIVVLPLLGQRAEAIKVIPGASSSPVSERCPEDAGDVVMDEFDGQSSINTLPGPIYLCYQDQFKLLNVNSDFDCNDPDLFSPPGIGYVFYNDVPSIPGNTVNDINSDPSIERNPPAPDGNFWVYGDQQNGDATFQNDGYIQNTFNGGGPEQMWFAPITMDDFAQRLVQENGGSTVVSTDQAFSVIYLNEITLSAKQTDANALTGSFVLSGGLPEWDGSTYNDIGIFKVGNPSIRGTVVPGNYGHGSTVNFTVPELGTYRIYIEDGVSCGAVMDVLFGANTQDVNLNVSDVTGEPGETVCVSFCVANFNEVASMQYTISFDPNMLTYSSLENINLFGLTESGSFNFTNGAIGIVNLTWFDQTTLGQTLADGSCLFDLCFEISADAQPGDCSSVNITGTPTPIELISAQSETLVPIVTPGEVCITPNSDLSVFVNTCNAPSGTLTGSLSFQIYGGVGPYSYELVNQGINDSGVSEGELVIINNLSSGPYIIRVFDSSGDLVQSTVNIGSGPSLTVDLVGTDPLCFNISNGSITANVSGGVSASGDYSYQWSNFVYNTNSLTQLPEGNYSVTVTDDNGCQVTESEYIGKDPITVNFTVQNLPTCETSRNGVVTAIASGGTPSANGDYTYQWSSPNNFVQQTDISQNFNVMAGVVNIRVTDEVGCPWDQQFTLDFEKELDAEIVYEQEVLCEDDEFAVLQIFGSFADGTPFFRGGSQVDPNVFVQGANDHIRIPELYPGTYNITLSDRDTGCEVDTTIVIPDIMPLTLDYNANTDCTTGAVGTVTLEPTGGTADYTFEWEDGSTLGSRNDLDIGDYMVTVTDNNGCIADTMVSITTSGSIAIDAVTIENVGCDGNSSGSISVSVTGSGNISYAWEGPGSPFGNTASINNLNLGLYYLTATDDMGCIAVDSFQIVEASSFTIDISSNMPFCASESNGTLAATVAIPGTYSFVWDHPNNDNTQILDQIPAGDYGLTVSDANGCSKDTIVTLDAPPAIDFVLDNVSPTSCYNFSDGGATVSVSGGKVDDGQYGFLWSSGEGSPLAAGNNSSTANQLPPLTQYVIAFDAECADTFYFDVPAPDSIVLDMANTIIENTTCFGSDDGRAEIFAMGGTAPYEYEWLGDTRVDGQVLDQLAPGYHIYGIVDNNNCFVIDSVLIEEPDSLVVQVDSMATRNLGCGGDMDGAITVIANGGNTEQSYTYAWSNGNSTTQTLSGVGAGIYMVTVTDFKGCSDTATYEMVDPLPVTAVIPEPDEPVCFGDQTCIMVLSAQGGSGMGYRFSVNSGPLNSIDTCLNVFAGTYDIQVFDNSGCSYDTSLIINQPEELVLDLGPDIEIDLGDSTRIIDIDASGPNPIANVFVNPTNGISCVVDDCTRVNIYPIQNTLYQVLVQDVLGCEASDELLVTINRTVKVYFPNIFSPNNDGFNDIFNMYTGIGITSINEFRVFDRWGNQMYALFNIPPSGSGTDGWDGTYRGSPVDSGVYTYFAEVTLIDGEEVIVRGDVTLVR